MLERFIKNISDRQCAAFNHWRDSLFWQRNGSDFWGYMLDRQLELLWVPESDHPDWGRSHCGLLRFWSDGRYIWFPRLRFILMLCTEYRGYKNNPDRCNTKAYRKQVESHHEYMRSRFPFNGSGNSVK